MYLFYLDESGNTGANLDSVDQPIHWLVALGVTMEAVARIESEMLAIAERYFSFRARNADFELHGNDLFSGRGEARALTVAQRVSLYGEVLELVGRFGGRLFVRGIDKKRHKERAARMGYRPEHPHRLGFMYQVERLDEWLERQQPQANQSPASGPSAYGLVVADEQKEVDRDVVRGFAFWRMYGTEHGYRTRDILYLIDTVHYVPSQDSWLIQLVDCVAFLRNRYEKLCRGKGVDESKYTESERAVKRLWRDFCVPHVETDRIWP